MPSAQVEADQAMPWKKGQSGNPLGRLPGEKLFAEQLRIVLAEPVDKNDPKSVRKLRRIAEKLAECALNGDPWASLRWQTELMASRSKRAMSVSRQRDTWSRFQQI
jgi:Family of unknown function (DUF5681)